ncbi:MAG: PQQ-binding-like beta-propeller repeat protein [Brevundimonas sp.]|uniref:PQQ-like beta-propeller repeat protein n=1 Tax=Brevundimonas sp. TaxID=1871086 RepID=UPI0025BE3439|nr:PQQ-like beta-propeller repeat protein [Brevundimonas sp.]MBX3476417.1 PQQ-binding-like beta-propeller repeat protein [Brevundimonas sp.]
MSRVLKVAVICALAVSAAGCTTVRRALPFNLGRVEEPRAVASEGERISVLDFEQRLAPSAALSGRDFFIPGPQAATAWTQPGRNAENALDHVIAAPNFTIAWTRNIGVGSGGSRQVMAPVVAANGRVFVMDGESTVSAVDPSTGAVAWKVNLKPEGHEPGSGVLGLPLISVGGGALSGGFGGGLAVGGDKLFVTSGYRVVAALNVATGAVVWSKAVEAPIHGAPTVAGNRVFVIDVDNQMIAFNTETGEQDWTYRGIVEPARIMRAVSPAVTGDTVIAPFSSGEVVALRSNNGQPVWQQVLSRTSRTSALSEMRDIAGRPVVSRGMVYAVSHSGVLSAMDIRSGQPRWQLPVAGVNAPLPVGDVVYVMSKDGELTVVNRDTGQVYWTRNLNEGRIRKEGGFLGFFDKMVRPYWTGPVLASNRLVLVNSDGEMLGLNPKTGEVEATLNLGAPAFIAPSAYDGALYVLTDKGQLVSVR